MKLTDKISLEYQERIKPIIHKGLGGYYYFGCNISTEILDKAMTLDYYSELNKLNQITMHEKLIKQIKELTGVKTVIYGTTEN